MPSHPLHIVLVEPEIPWNTGNAGRTCLAIGAQLHLIKPFGFNLDEASIRRSGLDYWAEVNPILWNSFEHFERDYPNIHDAFWVSPDGVRCFWDIQFPKPCTLLFGREGGGFPNTLREKYKNNLIHLPMAKNSTRSLNLSTSVGIASYEVLRQWR